jgi:hypothetical protein
MTHAEIPPPPTGLNDSAVRFWTHVHEATPIGDHERAILTRLCRVLTLVDRLEDAVYADGDFTVPGSHGSTVVHPLLPEIRLQLGIVNQLYRTLSLHQVFGDTTDGSKPTSDLPANVLDMVNRGLVRKGTGNA